MQFRSDMEHLIDEIRQRLRGILVSDSFQKKLGQLKEYYDQQEQSTVRPLYKSLKRRLHNHVLQGSKTPEENFADPVIAFSGVGTIPAATSAVAIFDQPQPVDYRIIRDRVRLLKKRCTEELDALTREHAREAIHPLMARIRKKYRRLPKVLVYLEDVEEDILNNLHIFTLPTEEDSPGAPVNTERYTSHQDLYSPYTVNVLVSRADTKRRPLVFVRNAGCEDLFGCFNNTHRSLPLSRIDFTQIKAGDLHRANGGILVFEASWILRRFHLWEMLKSTVSQKEISFMPAVPHGSFFATGSPNAEAIPFNATIVISGSTCAYSILSFVDPDFCSLVGRPIGSKVPASGRRLPKETSFDNMRTISSRKYFHISARQAIVSLCSHPQFMKGDFESHLMKLLLVIERAQDYSETRMVTAEHIEKALKETYPETANLIETVISGRRTIRRYKADSKLHQPEEIIESVKLLSGKVKVYGKQT